MLTENENNVLFAGLNIPVTVRNVRKILASIEDLVTYKLYV